MDDCSWSGGGMTSRISKLLGCLLRLKERGGVVSLTLFFALLAGCVEGAPDLQTLAQRQDAPAIAAAGQRQSFGKRQQVDPASASGDNSLKIVRTLPVPPAARQGREGAISPGDVLGILFFGVEKLNQDVRVDNAGNISMPLIGVVRAAGKTTRELERELVRRYGKSYLQNPQIAVQLKESMGQRFTINGEVRKPGILPLPPGGTLMQAVAQAGGFTQIGDPSKVFVFRKIGGKRYVAQYNVNAIQGGRAPDVRIYGGDVIVVFPSSTKVAMETLKGVLGLATSTRALVPAP